MHRIAKLSILALFGCLLGYPALKANAATLCVRPGGAGGCYAKINAAIAAANPGDTISVARGSYAEDVVIGKSVALLGAGSGQTTIDATGLANGIYVDGIDHTGLRAVIIDGFAIRNANFEGILVANAADVTVRDNVLTGNDKALVVSSAGPTCPGIPAFETGESFDCGEALHLTGVDHSIIEGNTVTNNAGGILISDDTGPTYQNLIRANRVLRNPLDCGITVASHAPSTGAPISFGVYQNTIEANESSENGLADGGGAGIGLFAGGPGNKVYANVVIGNRLIGNGLPGVAMHNHFSLPDLPADLDDNMILGNYIAGNHADSADTATSGPTGINVFGFGPINGTVISGNVIHDEDIDVAVHTASEVSVHLNDLLGRDAGVANTGSGTVNATQNWWGCSGGPGHAGCSTAQGPDVSVAPWLTRPAGAGHPDGH